VILKKTKSKIDGGSEAQFIEVQCPSTGEIFHLGVPEYFTDAAEARAWTLYEDEWTVYEDEKLEDLKLKNFKQNNKKIKEVIVDGGLKTKLEMLTLEEKILSQKSEKNGLILFSDQIGVDVSIKRNVRMG